MVLGVIVYWGRPRDNCLSVPEVTKEEIKGKTTDRHIVYSLIETESTHSVLSSGFIDDFLRRESGA